MNTQQDQEREAFEREAFEREMMRLYRWMPGSFVVDALKPKRGTVEYLDGWTHTAWDAWQARAALAQQAEPVRVPEGFALVPVEPTEAMLTAAQRDCSGIGGGSCGEYIGVAGSDFAWVWEVMLTAAQAAQPEPQSVMFNGLTEAETMATASVAGLTEPQRVGLSDEQRNDLIDAADVLDAEARSTFDCHTLGGVWSADGLSNAAKEDYDHFKRLAAALRGIAHGIKEPT